MASIKKKMRKPELHVIFCFDNRREIDGILTVAVAMKIRQLDN